MGNITIQGDLTGDVPGGEVGGASNLTTVGAIPYVSASGVLNQDPTALFWNAANNRLGVGTNAPAATLVVSDAGNAMSFGSVAGAYVGLAAGNGAVSASNFFITSNGGVTGVNTNSTSGHIYFGVVNAEKMRLAGSTGNFLIGTATDSNFKLDVAASGSAGTARFYGGAGVSNSTKVVVQAGGGQSTTNLTEWQDSAGAVLSSTSSSGGFNVASVSSSTWWNLSPGDSVNQGIEFSSTVPVRWSNATGNYAATKDLGLARNAAGVLEVNNGTAGTYRDLILRRSQHNGVTVADLPTAAAGNAGSIQYVTDANSTSIGSTVAGGGANKVMVWSDGAAWKIFAS